VDTTSASDPKMVTVMVGYNDLGGEWRGMVDGEGQ